MKKTFHIYLMILSLFTLTLVSCEDKIDPLVEELSFDQVFTPLGLEAFIRNKTNVELNWEVKADADYYIVEFAEDSLEFNTIVKTVTVQPDEVPFTQALSGETRYSARVKGVQTDGVADSKWAAITFMTDIENIFQAIQDDDIEALQATLRWTAGAEVTELIIGPDNVSRTITADEKAAGMATITGLTGETTYTVTLKNGTKTRGTVTFTTLIDLGGAMAIEPGDDIVSILDAAADGDAFVIFAGEYSLGAYTLTKSIKLSGYKTSEKPIIYGQLICGSTVSSVDLKTLIFKGNGTETVLGQFFNVTSGCNITQLTIDDCEISNYANNLIYNNASGVFGTISISNSYVHDIPGSGGDGIDFRSGTIGKLKVENSTFANGFRTFLRMQVQCNVSFKSCTFYKVCFLDNSNNNGLFRMNATAGGTFSVTDCLFCETGIDNPTSVQVGNFCRQASYMVALPSYSNNDIYSCHNLMVGLYTSVSQVDASEIDPMFEDAANGNFKITNQSLLDKVIGDLTW